jgi:hypothetical protein
VDHQPNSPCVDWEEDKKEENDQTLSSHESVLDNVTPSPIWMAHEWPMSAGARV